MKKAALEAVSDPLSRSHAGAVDECKYDQLLSLRPKA